MESSSSAFEAGVQDDVGDPFGADGEGDFRQPDPFDEEDAARAETGAGLGEEAQPIPTVDREGNPVKSDPTGAAESAAATDPAGTDSAAPVSTSTEQPELAGHPTAEQAAQPKVGSDGQPLQKPGSPAMQAAEAASSDPSGAVSEPSSAATAEPKAKREEGRRREYLVMLCEGAGVYKEVSWYEDKKGQIVAKGTTGAKLTKSCHTHSAEQALAVGFQAVGAPPEGASMVAVSSRAFRVRRIAPRPVQPIRTQIEIR